ncbi:MAG TPA: hypothetical protein VFV52_15000 [Bacilli bacterium]|nr:hypothetical protein [Bacilli bacterium]
MKRLARRWSEERGVTLLELLAVCVLMGLVFGSIVSFLSFNYDTYRTTNDRSLNGEEAATIIRHLSEDVRHAVQVDTSGAVTLVKRLEPLEQVVYAANGTALDYLNEQGTRIRLSEQATVEVEQDSSDPLRYTLRVTVGADDTPEQVVLTTAVSRYDWGR